VVVSGGFAATSGVPEVLAEQLSVLSGGTQRFLVLRASAPDSAVVRGGLVYGELELRAQLAGAA
jgi:hypothetical protein